MFQLSGSAPRKIRGTTVRERRDQDYWRRRQRVPHVRLLAARPDRCAAAGGQRSVCGMSAARDLLELRDAPRPAVPQTGGGDRRTKGCGGCCRESEAWCRWSCWRPSPVCWCRFVARRSRWACVIRRSPRPARARQERGPRATTRPRPRPSKRALTYHHRDPRRVRHGTCANGWPSTTTRSTSTRPTMERETSVPVSQEDLRFVKTAISTCPEVFSRQRTDTNVRPVQRGRVRPAHRASGRTSAAVAAAAGRVVRGDDGGDLAPEVVAVVLIVALVVERFGEERRDDGDGDVFGREVRLGGADAAVQRVLQDPRAGQHDAEARVVHLALGEAAGLAHRFLRRR